MDNSGIAPSPVTTIEDMVSKISLIHGAMHQYNDGDRELELLITIIERYRELPANAATIVGGTPKQLREVSRKLKYITEGLTASRWRLVEAGILPKLPSGRK